MDTLGLQLLFKAVSLTASRQLGCRLAREFVLGLGAGWWNLAMHFGVHFRNSAAFQAQEKTISCQKLD